MYPEDIIAPMRAELSEIGFEELRTPELVDAAFRSDELQLLVVNSVCGCAAGNARPAVRLALESDAVKPSKLTTVFAGGDVEATARFRELIPDYPPSSPSIWLLKGGKVLHAIERRDIEGRSAEDIAAELVEVFGGDA